jgi:hypothetical protein
MEPEIDDIGPFTTPDSATRRARKLATKLHSKLYGREYVLLTGHRCPGLLLPDNGLQR